MTSEQTSSATGRLLMGAIGALAGLCLWLLVDVLENSFSPRLYLALVTYYGVFFTGLLALAGPMRLARACGFSLVQAALVTALVIWASLRFDTVEPTLESPPVWLAAILLTLIPLPFAITQAQEGRWNSYSGLFTHSWDIVVRYVAAWLFVGVVWGVVMLSDALFQLVGITVIEWLLDVDAVPFLLTGATLGVALAVVNELSDYVSPYLVLRLLRLLLPVVLFVVIVFLAALPFRGLSHLFGGLSAATTLMAMAMGATTLITTALDTDDSRAAGSRAMQIMTQLLALTLPALGAAAALAIGMRVAQYGWTPDRLAAATMAFLVVAYGVVYAITVVLRGNWAGRIRQANTVMALVVIAVSALWLSPVINPQRISTQNQVARFEAGKTDVADLDLWQIGREWGRAGEAGIARLLALQDHPQANELATRLARLDEATGRSAYQAGERTAGLTGRIETLRETLVVVPEGAEVPAEFFDDLRVHQVDRLHTACKSQTPAGRPGCVALIVDLTDQYLGDEIVLFELRSGRLGMTAYMLLDGLYDDRNPRYLIGESFSQNGGAILDQLIDGAFSLAPVPARVLELGGRRIFFGP